MSVASSADGTKLVAAVINGQIYTSVANPADVYVDASYGTSCAEVTFPATGGTGAYYIGYNAFKTIQAGINAVALNGIVHVAAGTYHEQVAITKALTVTGNDGAVLDGTGLVPTWTTGVKIKSGNVTWNNVDVTKFTQDGIVCGYEASTPGSLPNIHITNCKVSDIQPGYWGFGIYVGYEGEAWGTPKLLTHLDYSGLLIEGNEIVNTKCSGLVLQSITASSGSLVVRNNYIHGITVNDAIWIEGARKVLIENNTVADSLWGIDITGYTGEDWYVVDGDYGPKDVTIQGNFIRNNVEQGLAIYNGWPSTFVVTSNYIEGNGTSGLDNFLSAAVSATGNWWGDLSGPHNDTLNYYGAGDDVSANVTFSPWLKYGDDTSPDPGFQPRTDVLNTPTQLVFTAQPAGPFALGEVLTPNPVLEVRDALGNLTPWAEPSVAMAIKLPNPGGGVLAGTYPKSAPGGTVTFADLNITVGGGSGYQLVASATALASATSTAFDVNSSTPVIASLNPFWIRAGSADFTLEVTGTGFVPTSKIYWNGVARTTTTFVSATKLTTLITTAEIGTPGSLPVKVVTPAPGGGTTAELTFRIEAASPTMVYVDDGFAGKSPDDLVDWPCPTGTCPGTHIIGYDAFAALPDGVSAVAPGGTVHVAAGTYAGIVGSKDFALVNEVGVVIAGASPALVINSGSITVTGGTLTTASADPTILVAGGSLALRNAMVQESTGSDQAAISVTSGTLDLGTTPSSGGNTININGAGSLLSNTGANPISAIGNAWQQGGVAITSNFDIENEIYHPLDAGNTSAGLVTWVANNVYVSTTSGSIQRAINAVPAA